MKKILKNPILTFIIGIILSGGIVFAASIYARDITYDNTNSGLKDSNNNNITNVQDAIDILYNKSNSPISFGTPSYEYTLNTLSNESQYQTIDLNKGEYIVLATFGLAWTRNGSLSGAENYQISLSSTNNSTINNLSCQAFNKTGTDTYSNAYVATKARNCVYYVKVNSNTDTISFEYHDTVTNTVAPTIASFQAIPISY